MQGKRHKPSDEDRRLVKTLSAVGVRYVDIADKLEIDHDTLTKHYKKELTEGRMEANAAVAQTLFQQAKAGNTAAMIWPGVACGSNRPLTFDTMWCTCA